MTDMDRIITPTPQYPSPAITKERRKRNHKCKKENIIMSYVRLNGLGSFVNKFKIFIKILPYTFYVLYFQHQNDE